MKKYDAPPPEWDCQVLLSRISRTGEPYLESYALPMDGVIEHWGQTYSFRQPIHAQVSANYTGERILMHIEVSADVSLPCSRCLSETGLAIMGDLRYLFTLRPTQEERRKEDEGEEDTGEEDGDVDVIPVDNFQAELDLRAYVWETLILALPERALCSEDCKGLCPTCGQNRNDSVCGCREDTTDPRMAVLRDFDI